jgi:hypothetical protein
MKTFLSHRSEGLSMIDVTKYKNISYLNLHFNKLKIIDLSKN